MHSAPWLSTYTLEMQQVHRALLHAHIRPTTSALACVPSRARRILSLSRSSSPRAALILARVSSPAIPRTSCHTGVSRMPPRFLFDGERKRAAASGPDDGTHIAAGATSPLEILSDDGEKNRELFSSLLHGSSTDRTSGENLISQGDTRKMRAGTSSTADLHGACDNVYFAILTCRDVRRDREGRSLYRG